MPSFKPSKFKRAGINNKTVINLTACKAATEAPTPYSDPTRLIPIVPPGAEPNTAIAVSIPKNLLIRNAIKSPVINKENVIINAGFHKFCNSLKVSWLIPVPITVPIPIPSAVFVPNGQTAASIRPLALKTPAPMIAPNKEAAGIPVKIIKVPKPAPARI